MMRRSVKVKKEVEEEEDYFGGSEEEKEEESESEEEVKQKKKRVKRETVISTTTTTKTSKRRSSIKIKEESDESEEESESESESELSDSDIDIEKKRKVEHSIKYHQFKADDIKLIRTNLLQWYQKNKRDLPWRLKSLPIKDKDGSVTVKQLTQQEHAYRVWVSEIMCQQTRISVVVDYFNRWMTEWPSVGDLARATLEDVNKVWAGLGYYRRAKHLHLGAQYVVSNLKSIIPGTPDGLVKIPGIGPYSAGAISSIAFNNSVPLVDGNVIRVLSRLRAIGSDPKKKDSIKLHWKLAGDIVDPSHPGDFNQSLMELGATVCTITSPLCNQCPINTICNAKKEMEKDSKTSKTTTTTTTTTKNSISNYFIKQTNNNNNTIKKVEEKEEEKEESEPKIMDIEDLCKVCDSWSDTDSPTTTVCKYPKKVKKTKAREENVQVFIIQDVDTDLFWVVQRPDPGLLANLWESPCHITTLTTATKKKAKTKKDQDSDSDSDSDSSLSDEKEQVQVGKRKMKEKKNSSSIKVKVEENQIKDTIKKISAAMSNAISIQSIKSLGSTKHIFSHIIQQLDVHLVQVKFNQTKNKSTVKDKQNHKWVTKDKLMLIESLPVLIQNKIIDLLVNERSEVFEKTYITFTDELYQLAKVNKRWFALISSRIDQVSVRELTNKPFKPSGRKVHPLIKLLKVQQSDKYSIIRRLKSLLLDIKPATTQEEANCINEMFRKIALQEKFPFTSSLEHIYFPTGWWDEYDIAEDFERFFTEDYMRKYSCTSKTTGLGFKMTKIFANLSSMTLTLDYETRDGGTMLGMIKTIKEHMTQVKNLSWSIECGSDGEGSEYDSFEPLWDHSTTNFNLEQLSIDCYGMKMKHLYNVFREESKLAFFKAAHYVLKSNTDDLDMAVDSIKTNSTMTSLKLKNIYSNLTNDEKIKIQKALASNQTITNLSICQDLFGVSSSNSTDILSQSLIEFQYFESTQFNISEPLNNLNVINSLIMIIETNSHPNLKSIGIRMDKDYLDKQLKDRFIKACKSNTTLDTFKFKYLYPLESFELRLQDFKESKLTFFKAGAYRDTAELESNADDLDMVGDSIKTNSTLAYVSNHLYSTWNHQQLKKKQIAKMGCLHHHWNIYLSTNYWDEYHIAEDFEGFFTKDFSRRYSNGSRSIGFFRMTEIFANLSSMTLKLDYEIPDGGSMLAMIQTIKKICRGVSDGEGSGYPDIEPLWEHSTTNFNLEQLSIDCYGIQMKHLYNAFCEESKLQSFKVGGDGDPMELESNADDLDMAVDSIKTNSTLTSLNLKNIDSNLTNDEKIRIQKALAFNQTITNLSLGPIQGLFGVSSISTDIISQSLIEFKYLVSTESHISEHLNVINSIIMIIETNSHPNLKSIGISLDINDLDKQLIDGFTKAFKANTTLDTFKFKWFELRLQDVSSNNIDERINNFWTRINKEDESEYTRHSRRTRRTE
ncbi:mutY like protein [Cavenderia fasciculata]|uniref:Adenine DNA glycosylase n=1 Tax=Cavenderia fasciculata TaxID=261658 RepID=F4PZ07_CACFS|nr:mutY like protein [Cavenderia fasciculata]EGG19036.1 mutY like protein [Cavenderia fasciculata]|eukprot:XP_004366669.1 mutY like protein [Cavenderia fasciculata]